MKHSKSSDLKRQKPKREIAIDSSEFSSSKIVIPNVSIGSPDYSDDDRSRVSELSLSIYLNLLHDLKIEGIR
jgi:hypothetical protein